MKKRFLAQAECGFCRRETTFRLLSERDQRGRTLMVCTHCGRKQPKPGDQEKDPSASSS